MTRSGGAPRAPEDSNAAGQPTALDGLLDACGVGIHVLSTDAELIETIRQVSSAHPTISVVATWQRLREAIDAGRCGIVLLDTDCIGEVRDKCLVALSRHAARPVVVAAGTVSEAPELMQALAQRRIHRLVIKPSAPGQVRLLLEAAIRRRLALRAPDDEPAVPGPSFDEPVPVKASQPARRRLVALVTGMLLVFAVVVALGLGLGRSGPAPEPAPGPLTTPVAEAPRPVAAPDPAPMTIQREAPAVVEDPFAERLAMAEEALADGRLAEPPEANALQGFAGILAAAPDHAAAAAGLSATLEGLFTQAERALLDGELALAAATLEHVRAVRPDSSRLGFLDAQLSAAQAQAARREQQAAARRAAVPAPPPREVDALLALADSHLLRGELVTPAGDDALGYFHRAAALDATDAGVSEMRERLRGALFFSTLQALDADDTGRAEVLLAELRVLQAEPPMVDELEGRLAAVHERQHAARVAREAELLALGRERLRQGRLLAPPSDSAMHYLVSLQAENPAHPGLAETRRTLVEQLAGGVAAALAAADWGGAEAMLAGLGQLGAEPAVVAALAGQLTVARRQSGFLGTAVPAGELELLESRAPVYPESALRAGVEGWVELEFIVDRDGRPRDVEVTAAEPPGRFDRAALNAVARYRYQPYELDGVIYERRVNLRIRFALQ